MECLATAEKMQHSNKENSLMTESRSQDFSWKPHTKTFDLIHFDTEKMQSYFFLRVAWNTNKINQESERLIWVWQCELLILASWKPEAGKLQIQSLSGLLIKSECQPDTRPDARWGSVSKEPFEGMKVVCLCESACLSCSVPTSAPKGWLSNTREKRRKAAFH